MDEEEHRYATASGDSTRFPSDERLRQILLKQSIGARDVVPAHSRTASVEDTLLFMALATHFPGNSGDRLDSRHKRTRSSPVRCRRGAARTHSAGALEAVPRHSSAASWGSTALLPDRVAV